MSRHVCSGLRASNNQQCSISMDARGRACLLERQCSNDCHGVRVLRVAADLYLQAAGVVAAGNTCCLSSRCHGSHLLRDLLREAYWRMARMACSGIKYLQLRRLSRSQRMLQLSTLMPLQMPVPCSTHAEHQSTVPAEASSPPSLQCSSAQQLSQGQVCAVPGMRTAWCGTACMEPRTSRRRAGNMCSEHSELSWRGLEQQIWSLGTLLRQASCSAALLTCLLSRWCLLVR